MPPASPCRVPGKRPALVEPERPVAAATPPADSETELAAVAYADDTREEPRRLPNFIIFALIGGFSLALMLASLLVERR